MNNYGNLFEKFLMDAIANEPQIKAITNPAVPQIKSKTNPADTQKTYDEAATELYTMYRSFTKAGFTELQAWEIFKTIIEKQ